MSLTYCSNWRSKVTDISGDNIRMQTNITNVILQYDVSWRIVKCDGLIF